METIQKNDFVEIEFTGKSGNEIFDTTNKEDAKKIGIEIQDKPLIISVGNGMLLKAFDEYLEGKELNKKYSIHLEPEKAFGKRQSSMIKLIPMKVFLEKQIRPMPGMSLQIDNYVVKILAVSGGRVTVDFNNPLAGKEIDYDFIIKRKITDDSEKVNALQDFFFRQRFEFSIEGKKVIFKEEKIKPFVEIFKQKFKEITGLDFEVLQKEVSNKEAAPKEVAQKAQENPQPKKPEKLPVKQKTLV
jgi:FKBP-type peptidyl-prolyl cis-trans isomerase 2